jgi:hypothetical protein
MAHLGSHAKQGSYNQQMVFPLLYIGKNIADYPWNFGVESTLGSNGMPWVPFADRKSIRGYVQNDGSGGIARTVLAIDRTTYRVWGWTTSSAVDGSFELRPPTVRPTLIVHLPATADNRNAVALDRITPVNH